VRRANLTPFREVRVGTGEKKKAFGGEKVSSWNERGWSDGHRQKEEDQTGNKKGERKKSEKGRRTGERTAQTKRGLKKKVHRVKKKRAAFDDGIDGERKLATSKKRGRKLDRRKERKKIREGKKKRPVHRHRYTGGGASVSPLF